MKYLSLQEVLDIHQRVCQQAGGVADLRDLGGVESAVAQPQMTFGGVDLYPTIGHKAAALGFSLVKNHPFIDGNKRIGYAAMEVFLWINGWEFDAVVDDSESIILQLAAGELSRDAFCDWVAARIQPRRSAT